MQVNIAVPWIIWVLFSGPLLNFRGVDGRHFGAQLLTIYRFCWFYLLHRNDWKRFVAFIESGANAADVRTHCVGPGAYTSNTTVTVYIDIYSLGKKKINNMVQHLYPV